MITPSSQINRTLRANLAAAPLAQALYLALLETNCEPGAHWEHLPIRLRAALIECCGRILLHLGPIHTHAAMTAAVFDLATDLARCTGPLAVTRPMGRLRRLTNEPDPAA